MANVCVLQANNKEPSTGRNCPFKESCLLRAEVQKETEANYWYQCLHEASAASDFFQLFFFIVHSCAHQDTNHAVLLKFEQKCSNFGCSSIFCDINKLVS